MAALSDKSELQTAAHLQAQSLDRYEEDVLKRSVILHQAFQEYRDHGKDMPRKTVVTKYFLHKILQDFKRQGIDLSVAQRTELVGLEKDIKQLVSQYLSNIEYDSRKIIVPVKGLKGLSKGFIQSLRKDVHGDCIVPVDQTTYNSIMRDCRIERTRKEFYLAFGQRAYPQNMSVLQDIMQFGHTYATKLDFTDLASYQIQNQMLKQTKKVESFLWNLIYELQKYETVDFQEFTKDLPDSVTLTKDKKIKPWDYDFVVASYRKKHFDLPKRVSEYFQVEQVLPKLLHLLHSLFYIEFELKEVEDEQLWAPGVICYRVRSLKNQTVIGYLFLDLYKRPGKKVKHPMHMTLVPTIKDDCSISCAGSSVLAANFALSSEEKPTLLSFDDVKTLFKQLGHSMHDLIGSTCFADFAGTQVEKDFLKTPSHVLEFWLHDAKTLQSISSHYKTGQKLSKDKIEQMFAAHEFDQGHILLKEAFVDLVSLNLFKEGAQRDTHKIIEKMYKKVFKHIGYDASYYIEYTTPSIVTNMALDYIDLWSKTTAADLYDHMQQSGMNYDIGKEYLKHILQPGGFASPAVMMKRFLRRSINHYALFKQFKKE